MELLETRATASTPDKAKHAMSSVTFGRSDEGRAPSTARGKTAMLGTGGHRPRGESTCVNVCTSRLASPGAPLCGLHADCYAHKQ